MEIPRQMREDPGRQYGSHQPAERRTQTFLEQPEKEKTRQGETAKAAIQGIPSREA